MDYTEDEHGDNPVDDMMVDYDCHINTGELPELFDEPTIDDIVANLDDWD